MWMRCQCRNVYFCDCQLWADWLFKIKLLKHYIIWEPRLYSVRQEVWYEVWGCWLIALNIYCSSFVFSINIDNWRELEVRCLKKQLIGDVAESLKRESKKNQNNHSVRRDDEKMYGWGFFTNPFTYFHLSNCVIIEWLSLVKIVYFLASLLCGLLSSLCIILSHGWKLHHTGQIIMWNILR